MKHIRLQLYNVPPVNEDPTSIYHLQDITIQRFDVLRTVDSLSRSTSKENLHDAMFKLNDLSKSLWYTSDNDPHKSIKKDIRNDIVSHFFLAMACCTSDDMRRWFLQQELELFRYRFNLEKSNSKSITKFIQDNNIKFIELDEKEQEHVDKYFAKPMKTYRCPLREVHDLMKQNLVEIKGEWAYVQETHVVSLMMGIQREAISETLSTCRRYIYELDDTRIMRIMEMVKNRFMGNSAWTSAAPSDSIKAEDVDKLALRSFPPCMQQIHKRLRQDHHLKHWGRMQFGLFLKGVGLPLEESLKFWSRSFQPKIDATKFEKQYAYSVRHNYGKEGKQADYKPYSCVKIITSNVPSGPNDCHGCPFATGHTQSVLNQLSSENKLSDDTRNAIQRTVRDRHFQISCAHHFRAMHSLPADHPVVIGHPNQYVEESLKLLKPPGSAAANKNAFSK